MKKAKDIFSILIIVLCVFVVYRFYSYSKRKSQFESQKLNVSLEVFKSDWGKPDYEFISKDCADNPVLKYECKNFLGHQYVFVFDKKAKKLNGKYYDD